MRHLDEGEIHAWLDGAVAADEAARIEAHVAGCARCAGEVATARGLIAGASRILLALDDMPGGVIPGRSVTATPGASEPARVSEASDLQIQRTKAAERRHNPWFSRPLVRIAAGLVLAAGIGTVAARQDTEESNQVRIELRTEPVELNVSAPGASGSVDSSSPSGFASAADASGAIAQDAELSRRAVELPPPAALPAPVALPPAVVGGADASSPIERRTAATMKTRQATPVTAEAPVAAPTSPPAQPESRVGAREEARPRTVVGGVGAGGAGGGGVASGSALADSAALARRELRLQSVVVTSGIPGARRDSPPLPLIPTDSLAVSGLGFAVRPSLGGSCYAVELAAPPEVPRGEMPLPRTMRIRLADLQNVTAYVPRTEPAAANAKASSIQLRAPARATQAQPPVAMAEATEAVETVEWESVARDSIVARRLAGLDVIVFRLAIGGEEITGTAVAQTATTPPVRVTGRRISCDGSF